jgi:hypothetical protein
MQLWDYPHLNVRVSCECGYRAAYKLVRLGELFGARTEIEVVLERAICSSTFIVSNSPSPLFRQI